MTNAEIQIALNAAGYGPLVVDGQVGQKTLEAVKKFQRLNQLMPDGVIGTKTTAKLQVHLDRVPALVPAAAEAEPGGNVFSAMGMKMLGLSEGIRTHAYYDSVKVLTIGIGATWGSSTFRKWWAENKPNHSFTINTILTLDEISKVTRLMIDEEYGKAVDKLVGGKKIPQHAFDAATHFLYNVGIGATSWRWAEPFKNGDYVGAAAILKQYRKPPEIGGRRDREAKLMATGVYHV